MLGTMIEPSFRRLAIPFIRTSGKVPGFYIPGQFLMQPLNLTFDLKCQFLEGPSGHPLKALKQHWLV